MILEGLVTTCDSEGRVNVAPMGPIVDDAGLDGPELTLRPFSGSTTYRYLRETGRGVFHVTDNVLLLARAAVSHVEDVPLAPIKDFPVPRLVDCCRWRAFAVSEADWEERATVRTSPVVDGRVRDYFGLNRAKHAVVEATILATRLHLTGPEEVRRELDRLTPLIEKTAGSQEREAFELIEWYVDGWPGTTE